MASDTSLLDPGAEWIRQAPRPRKCALLLLLLLATALASCSSPPGPRSASPAVEAPTASAAPGEDPVIGDFPTGRYSLEVRLGDRPPVNTWGGGTFELDFRPDGRFLIYGRIDTEGEYVVRGQEVELRRDASCRNDRQVGYYSWVAAGRSLTFALGRSGDPCVNRSWLLTLRPWTRVGDNSG